MLRHVVFFLNFMIYVLNDVAEARSAAHVAAEGSPSGRDWSYDEQLEGE
jgi:hypothetical protein